MPTPKQQPEHMADMNGCGGLTESEDVTCQRCGLNQKETDLVTWRDMFGLKILGIWKRRCKRCAEFVTGDIGE